jgi:protein SCO1
VKVKSSMKYRWMAAPLILAFGVSAARPLYADPRGARPLGEGVAAPTTLPEQLKDVGIDQRLNELVPLESQFADETGQVRPIGEFFRGKPVILSLVYYECPMLCTMVLNGLLKAIRAVPLTAGEDYDIITVSFDSKEKSELAAAKKQEYTVRYGRDSAKRGWHFLTGDETNIRALADAAGFRFKWDPVSNQWAHSSGIMVLTPEGRLSRYFYGVEYSARDLRLGLVDSSAGKVGSKVDQFLLFCFHYDVRQGKYSLLIMNVIRAAGVATLATLAAFWFVMARRERRKKKDHAERIPTIS